jgi:antirestriction protein ArdC
MSNRISTSPRADIYQCITDSIVRDLEEGTRPWIRPWIMSAGETSSIRPLRHVGTPYRGINVLILCQQPVLADIVRRHG